MVDPGSAGSDAREVSFDPDAAGSLGRRMLAAGLRGLAVGSKEMEEDARAFQALRAALAALAGFRSHPTSPPRRLLGGIWEVSRPDGRIRDWWPIYSPASPCRVGDRRTAKRSRSSACSGRGPAGSTRCSSSGWSRVSSPAGRTWRRFSVRGSGLGSTRWEGGSCRPRPIKRRSCS